MVKKFLTNLFHGVKNALPLQGFRQRAEIEVSGLREEEAMFRQSVSEACTLQLQKFRKTLPSIEGISLHAKGGFKKRRKQFELTGILRLKTGALRSKADGHDLNDALKELFSKLEREVRKMHSFSQNVRGGCLKGSEEER